MADELDFLQGFKQCLHMLDVACRHSIHNADAIREAKTLVRVYFPLLKKAKQGWEDAISWDNIIDAVKLSMFFQQNPDFLIEANPDLVRLAALPI